MQSPPGSDIPDTDASTDQPGGRTAMHFLDVQNAILPFLARVYCWSVYRDGLDWFLWTSAAQTQPSAHECVDPWLLTSRLI